MAKTSALSSGAEAIHTRTDGAGTAESQVAVIGIDGSDSVVPASTTGLVVDGNAAQGAVDAGSPVKVGGKYNTTPSLLTNGNRGDVQLGTRGSVKTQLMVPDSNTAAPTGGGVEASALRVTVADDSTGVLSVDDNGGSLTVDNSVLSVVGGGAQATAQRVTIANDSTGVVGVNDAGTSLTVDNPALSVVGNGIAGSALRVSIASDTTGVVGISDAGNSVTVDAPATDPLATRLYSAASTPVGIGGGVESAALRVTIANDSTGVVSVDDNGGLISIDDGSGSITVDDGGGSLTVDGTITLGAGGSTVGNVGVNTLPGNLTGKAEDTASAPADVGLPILGVRNDTPTSLVGTDGDYAMIAVDQYGRQQIAPVRSLPKSIQVSGSIGITTAAVWNDKAVWAVPASTLFAPKMARCAVTTAGTRTLVLAGKQLATFNPGTNTFTATGSVTGNDFYDRMFYRVATTHSATATTITATYTDQGAASGNSTGGLVIASAAAGGSWFEFILAANDFGVQAVTAVSDTANPTSVVDEIWGFRTLLEDLGPATTPHISYLGEGLQIPTGESVVILFNAAATTAQQRFASVLGDLVAA